MDPSERVSANALANAAKFLKQDRPRPSPAEILKKYQTKKVEHVAAVSCCSPLVSSVALKVMARRSASRAFCSWRARTCVMWSLQVCCQRHTTSTYAAGQQTLAL